MTESVIFSHTCIYMYLCNKFLSLFLQFTHYGLFPLQSHFSQVIPGVCVSVRGREREREGEGGREGERGREGKQTLLYTTNKHFPI